MVEDHVDYPGILLKILGIVGIIFGLAFGLPGILLLMHGGSWFFAIAGLMTVIAGWLIFRGEGRGVALYCAVCIFAVGWSIWDVRALDSWFWPLIPRLFAFGVALFAVLLLAPLIPQWRHDRGVRNGFLIAAAVVGLGLAATVAMMFRPHGVIRHDFAAAPNTAVSQVARDMGGEWHNYGRTLTATRFTPEDQINKDNIDQLQVAWTYQTGVYVEGTNSDQNTPAYANGTLYSCTPTNQIHALDPLTGQVKWVFDPDAYTAFSGRCRGLTYYEVAGTAGGVCTKRLAMTTIDARLFSIDADTGQPCQDFGTDGAVNMRDGMGYAAPGVYNSNSAPTVSHGKIVSGALVLDNYEVGEPSGVVRAWDAQTGQLAWAWDVGAPERGGAAPAEGEVYTPYTPNVWTHMAVDEDRGIIYLSTGNATPDVWLEHRRDFDDEYTDTIVALDIETGRELWHFRTVNKDLWDYDLPSQPSLYDIPDPATGEMIPVLVQPTKRGQIFMLNRVTGAPVAEVENRQVDISGGEPTLTGMSDVQPYSVGMPAIGAEPLTEAAMWGATPIDLVSCRLNFRKSRYTGNEFVAPGTDKAIQFPSALGGMNWGSASIDESRGLLFVNDIRFPMLANLVPRQNVPHEQWPKDGHAKMSPISWARPSGFSAVRWLRPLVCPACTHPMARLARLT